MCRSAVAGLFVLTVLTVRTEMIFGEDHQPWVGRQVMVRSARSQPRVGGHVAAKPIVCVRTVKRANGSWLSVDDGWLRSKDVVPLEEAVAIFTTQIEHRPSTFDYLSRAAARCALGDYEGAAADCGSALQINPRLEAAYYHRAAAQAEQGRFEEAISDYNAALRINPRLVGAYVDRGAARSKLGDYAGSLRDANHALRLSPREPDAHYLRGLARLHLRQYGGALSDLNYVVRANPKKSAAYDARGTCKLELGRRDEAVKDFDKAIELDPSNVSANSHRESLRMAQAPK